MQLDIGQVFRLHCQTCHTPKPKFFVVALVDPLRFFLINSNPTLLQKSKPELMHALALVHTVQQKFLHHDSYVACDMLFAEYDLEQLEAEVTAHPECQVGCLHTAGRKAVARAVRGNRQLPSKYREPLERAWPLDIPDSNKGAP